MSAIAQEVSGIVLSDGTRTALALTDQGGPVYLRYGLQTFVEDLVIMPELALDDWGREIRGLQLYQWVQENGQLFPRAEVFGYDPSGVRQQYFLRDIDLMAQYPCYVYVSRSIPLTEGRMVEVVLVPVPGTRQLRSRRRPPDIEEPLRNARVAWWEIDPAEIETFNFALLDSHGQKAGPDLT